MAHGSAFSDVLAQLRVSGAVVLSHQYQSPWAIDVPSANELAKMLAVDSQATIIPFHIVTQGWLDYVPETGQKIRVESGQFVVCVNGNGHALLNGEPHAHYQFAELIHHSHQLGCVKETEQTALLCGAFLLQNTRNNPLINALPEVLHVDANGTDSTFAMQQIYHMFVHELQNNNTGKEYMLERLLEVMYTESVRDYVNKHPELSGNWLTAQTDQRINKALNHIHKYIDSELSVARLADKVHMSRSRFAALFKHAVGVSPMAYIANWRMQLAANQLTHSSKSVGQIAELIGYGSRAAFNHAFTRLYGCSPVTWRKSKQGSDLDKVAT